ncbi:MAG: ABC transporter transmembrane domain-containing protein [Alphaproteobacteria bacterium]|nr:ABC transporter transmembrane domain-containing protein [Alphaproteobacteria bacterium]
MTHEHTNSWYLIKRLMKSYLAKHKSRIITAVFCMLIVSATTAGITYMVKPMLDEVFIAGKKSYLMWVPIIILGLFLFKTFATYIQGYYMEYVGQKLVADLQFDLFKHTMNQDLTFFQTHTTSGLSSRFLFDLQRLKGAVSQTISGTLRDFTSVIGLVGVMFVQEPLLALISLTLLPLAAVPILRFGKRMRRYSTGSQSETGRLSAILKEAFGYNRQVKIYSMEHYENARAKEAIDNVFSYTVKSARVRAIASPMMELLGGVSIALIVAYGGHRVLDGNITPGAFFSFLTALMMLYRPIKGIANINNVLQDGLAAAERTFALMDEPNKVTEKDGATALKVTKGDLHFKAVGLTYGDGTEALKSFALHVPAGKTVALVGSSGAGKSSVLNMIPRFFDPTSGDITIDGTSTQDVTLKSLRKHIALVTQDIAIFDDTVHNNIAYGAENARREDVIKAAKMAAAHEFVQTLDEGYDTVLGEEGFKLSGGQKQRIAIARAMIKNAPILLLDEATSSLDSESEQKVQDALSSLSKGRTTLVVAHRLSTIKDADQIHVMKHGQIVESGTHEELMKKKGTYTDLQNLQGHAS